MRVLLTLLLLASSLACAQPSADTSAPEKETFSVSPAFRFKSFKDFAVGVELSGTTLQNESVTTRLAVGPNPEQQFLSAAFLYTRPVDLIQEPAQVSVFATSDFTQRYPLTSDAPTEEVRTFTERLNQFGVELLQPVSERLEISLTGQLVGSEAFLEESDIPLETGIAPLPVDAFSALIEASVRYSSLGLGRTPALGVVLETSLGYGLGRSDRPLSWGQVQLRGRGYLSFGENLKVRGFSGQEVRRFTLVGGVNAGANLGAAPAWRRLSPELRGYDTFALVGQRYWAGTLEGRYHTGLDIAPLQAVALRDATPYLFVDAGNAWGGAASGRYRAPELGDGAQFSFGAGTQLGLETPLFDIPLNLWYARSAQGGKIGFEASYLY